MSKEEVGTTAGRGARVLSKKPKKSPWSTLETGEPQLLFSPPALASSFSAKYLTALARDLK